MTKPPQCNYPLEQWHKDLILKQFRLCYGLKQLVQDGKDYAIQALAERTGFNSNLLINNLETLKSL